MDAGKVNLTRGNDLPAGLTYMRKKMNALEFRDVYERLVYETLVESHDRAIKKRESLT